MDYFISRKIIDRKKAVLTFGSGVDLEKFPCPTLDEVAHARLYLGNELGVDLAGRKTMLFPARGVPEKGFFEFYEAAKILNQLEPDRFVFIHLGLFRLHQVRYQRMDLKNLQLNVECII